MSIFHDGCTAGPLSAWLNSMIGACCDLHDAALDHSTDLGTFIAGNWSFASCVWSVHWWLAPAVFAVVAGPVGLLFYRFGPKREASK